MNFPFQIGSLARFRVTCAAVVVALLVAAALAQESQPSSTPMAKAVGTIKAINGTTLTIVPGSGSSMDFVIQDSTRMLRTAPGAKDLKDATPVTLQDLQVGDRVLARGNPSNDGKSVLASSVIVIKGSDVAAKQQQEREDWQKRGVGGLVTAVDPSAGTVAISVSTMGGTKSTTIRISKDTIIRRYSPDSIKFDDAKTGSLDQVKAGDQLRARGTKNPDGTELTADEIVSGTFRNIAGLVLSTNPADNSVSVQDLATKKPVVLKISSDSQLRNLPAMMAQRIAARLKPPAGGATPPSQTAHEGEGRPPGAAGGNGRPGGGADFQQILNRMPAVTIGDLQKGTAVMIVATEGSATTQPTAVTLLTGVEPILTASPDSGRAAMLLSPWNLGGADAAAGAQ